MKAFSVCLAFIWLLGSLQAATYYVDFESGDDAHTGTSEIAAWQHLPIDTAAAGNAFAVVMQPGDTILLKGGVVYRGHLLSSGYFGRRNLGNGAEENPIVLKGDGWGDDKAVIDGSEMLTGWTQCASADDCGGNANWQHIWYTTVPAEWAAGSQRALSLNLYQGDRMMSVSQYPTMPNPFYYDNTSVYEEADEMTATYITDAKLADLDDAGLVGAYVALWCGNNSVSAQPISGYDPGANRISYADITNPYGYYSILNTLDEDVFDQEGEFCFDESTRTLYAWPFDGANPNTVEITASVYSTGIDFWGDNYITIEGFIVQKFIGQGISESSSPVAYGYTVRNNTVRFCRAPGGGHSINLNSTENSLVENNFIYRNAGPIRCFGLRGGNGHITRNNVIQESGKTGIYYSGVTNGMILNNRIVDNRGTHANGISTYQGCSNVLVAGNQVINSNIAFTFEQSTDIYAYNNIFIGSPGAYSVACWGGQDGAYIYHNLIGPVLYIPSATTKVAVKNNILLGSFTGQAGWEVSNNINAGGDPATDMSAVFYNSPVVQAALADVHKYDVVSNVTTVYLDGQYAAVITPGYYLVYDHDGRGRAISAVARKIYQGNWRTELVFSPALDTVEAVWVEIWKSMDNFAIDYRLCDNSLAQDSGRDLSSELPAGSFPGYDFGKDLAGNIRPSGRWDVGPYEYTANRIFDFQLSNADFPALPNPCKKADIGCRLKNEDLKIMDLSGRAVGSGRDIKYGIYLVGRGNGQHLVKTVIVE